MDIHSFADLNTAAEPADGRKSPSRGPAGARARELGAGGVSLPDLGPLTKHFVGTSLFLKVTRLSNSRKSNFPSLLAQKDFMSSLHNNEEASSSRLAIADMSHTSTFLLALCCCSYNALRVGAFSLSGSGAVRYFSSQRIQAEHVPKSSRRRRRANRPVHSLPLFGSQERWRDTTAAAFLSSLATEELQHEENDLSSSSVGCSINRRDLLKGLFSTSAATILLTSNVDASRAAAADTTSKSTSLPYGTPSSPILIIGGNGRTGMAVAEQLATSGLSTVVSTRSGRDPFAKIKLPTDVRERLQFYSGGGVDVRNIDSIAQALKTTNAGAVVYAASASKSGGNASEVDGTGPANVAQAIINAGGDVRLVLISALALDRPDSKSYQITNTMGGFIDKIMDEKLRGEEAVRTIMSGGNKGGGKGPGNYVIIRPGPLLSGKSKNGASDLELNQGDTVGGGLSRDELGGIVVGALQAGEIARGITVECYRSRTATALQPEFALPSGKELRGETYAALFGGARKD